MNDKERNVNERLRVGLIGAGRIGRIHAQTLVQAIPQAELVTVVDVALESAQGCARDLSVPHATQAVADVFNDDSVQAVVIASATDTHADLIIRAAQAGKHIFCEKPIASSLEQIDIALAAVEQAGVKLMVGFNRRFDPNHQRIKRAVDEGEIGAPHMMHIISRDPSPPPLEYVRVSGGMFFDMTIHDFDMARFLLGEVTEVYASASVLVDPAIGQAGDVDTAVILLKFASGAIGTIDNSRQAVYGYDQRVEVFGSGGSVASGNLHPDQVTVSTDQHIGRGLPLNFFMERYLTSYRVAMAEFVRCILKDTPPPVSGIDGRAPVVMAQAALLSYQQNRPVMLDEVGG